MPLISVIMPVYNVELYIREAIDSILSQTFLDFEYIIIDDGSTDKTSEIILSYIEPRIIYLRNKNNLGNYPSRNKGIKIARGKYIAIMDGDDIARTDRLEKQYCYLENNPSTIALTSFATILDSGSRKNKKEKKAKGGDKEQGKKIIPLSYEDICFSLLKGFLMLHPSLMAKTEMIRSLNGYNERYKYASDYDLFCQLSLRGRIENLPDSLITYRRHPEQISQLHSEEQNIYADDIRRNYQVAFINYHKNEKQVLADLSDVGIPEIGLAICLYTCGCKFNYNEYKEEANRLIDVIYKVITKELPICTKDGLCGLGCGLLYLLRNGFVDGDENEVLVDIDNSVVKALQQGDVHKEDQLFYIKKRITPHQNCNSAEIQNLTVIFNKYNQ